MLGHFNSFESLIMLSVLLVPVAFAVIGIIKAIKSMTLKK